MEIKETEEMFMCVSCNKEFPLITAYKCKNCNRNNKNNIENSYYDDDDDDNDDDDDKSIDVLLFCKKCTNKCHSCDVRGCRKCIDVVCCDCCVSMCYKCRNNGKSLCGCYGKCYTCDFDLNRGSDG